MAARDIGIGNEMMIVPEYRAIKRCFRTVAPSSDYNPFLKANMEADVGHARLCISLAAKFIAAENGQDQRFLTLAKEAIESRVTYFDDLLCFAETTPANST